MVLQQFCGCLALVGPEVDALAHEVGTHDYSFVPTTSLYHITLVTKEELRSLKSSSSPQDILPKLQNALGNEHPRLHSLGLGGQLRLRPEVYFVVVIWAKGQQLRKLLGLAPKHFHITLSLRDAHDVEKGVTSLLHPFPADVSVELLDHLVFTLYSMGDYEHAKGCATKLYRSFSSSEKGFLRLGDSALKLAEYKPAMLSYACGHRRATDPNVQEYCIRAAPRRRNGVPSVQSGSSSNY